MADEKLTARENTSDAQNVSVLEIRRYRDDFLRLRALLVESGARRLVLVVATLSVLVATIFSGWGLDAVLDRFRDLLMSEVQLTERLISSMTVQRGDTAGQPDIVAIRDQLIDQLSKWHLNDESVQDPVQMMLAHRVGDRIELLNPLAASGVIPQPIMLDDEAAKPFRAALSGYRGVVYARDVEGTQTLAAYAPIEALDLVVVSQVDLFEIITPIAFLFFENLIIVVFVALAALWLSNRVNRPIFAHVQTYADEMELLSEKLSQSNDELERFAYLASHDLRVPLRGISHLTKWIEEDVGDQISEDGKRYIKLLSTRTERMEAMLSGLLEYSRLGRDDLPTEDVNIQELIEEISHFIVVPGGFAVRSQYSVDVINTIRAPLELVLRNLVGNAIMHHDQTEGEVVVSCKRHGDGYMFEVRDDEPGIEARFHERVFRMFETL